MDSNKKSLDAAYFDELYRQNQDPWNFEESEYEKMKYARTVSTIPNGQYENAFEIGCSNGLLSLMIREKCRKLLAVDSSSIAIENAKNRLESYPNVTVEQMEIPRQFPDEKFDLILLSEVGYFLAKNDLLAARDKIIQALRPGGHLLLVHWTPPVDEFPLTGDQVHELFLECAPKQLTHLENHTDPQYRMDLFAKVD